MDVNELYDVLLAYIRRQLLSDITSKLIKTLDFRCGLFLAKKGENHCRKPSHFPLVVLFSKDSA
jgi:hypothetical protein